MEREGTRATAEGRAERGEGALAAGGAASAPRARRRRRTVRLLSAFAALLGALVFAELGLRHLLFGQWGLALTLGPELRRPELFGLGYHEDDYWKLRALWKPGPRQSATRPDPALGWTGNMEPGTYAHPDEGLVGGRRPVLLYGDSNAQCMTPPELCFQGLMERSELGSRYALLNYGVGGYGLDQIYLMLRASIDRFADERPIVILSLMVDDNLERSMLTFREWPKPRFQVEGGRLVEPPPVVTDPDRYFAANPPSIRSYLYRLVRRVVGPRKNMLDRTPSELVERRALNGALLEAIHEELERRSLQYFFFLFYFESAMRRVGTARWSEELLLEFFDRTGAPFISMRDFLATICGKGYSCFEDLTGKGDPALRGHLNDAGNRLAFEAMLQGLEGRFGELDLERVQRLAAEGTFLPSGEQFQIATILGRSARLHFVGTGPVLRLEGRTRKHGGTLVGLRAASAHPTYLEIDLGGRMRRLSGQVGAVPMGAEPCSEPFLRFATRLDKGEWNEQRIEIGAPPLSFELELEGARALELRVSYDGADSECAWLALQRTILE